MINDFIRELFSWLGYLQRSSILLQIFTFFGALLIEPILLRRFRLGIKQEYTNLFIPAFLVLLSAACMAFSLPGGFLRYLSLVRKADEHAHDTATTFLSFHR